MARIPPLLALACLPLMPFAAARSGRAQILSPGRLASPHSQLGGVRNCTSCHGLSKAGASNEKCLACHEPLRNRVSSERGYHATLSDRSCASCHEEHLGLDASLIQLDTATFDHGETGFALAAGHTRAGCSDCHQPDFITAADVRGYKGEHGALARTYLGLGTICTDCHTKDDPHRDQFEGRRCDECHSESDWQEAERFDHDAVRYRLTGRHRRVACRDCHTTVRRRDGGVDIRFTSIDYASCESCHTDDHRGALGADCSGCHSTADWHRVPRRTVENRYDHSGTAFPLAGKHAQADCEDCHSGPRRDEQLRLSFERETRGFAYPHPLAEDCLSCHVDEHRAAFDAAPGGAVCDNCHDERDWIPTRYDIARHNRDASFELSGAHTAVPCIDCHSSPGPDGDAAQFRFASTECESCHEDENPHGAQFTGELCRSCHDVRTFSTPDFDHNRARYKLDGAHRDVPCASCHLDIENPDGKLTRRYKPLDFECRDCHGGES
jgi:hypothetical protein